MQAFYSDQFVLPLPPGHRFPMEKYARLRTRVERELPEVTLIVPDAATDGQLALAHTPAYIADIRQGTASSAQLREIGFPWSEAMVERSLRSVGATIGACRRALAGEGVAMNLAGGTHHAYRAKGSGFCVFNDAAVAARLMQAEAQRSGRGLSVAIVDLDVHQGNGTAEILRGDPSTFTLSIHAQSNFPFRKEHSDLDVALADGTDDDGYLAALSEALQTLDERFDPGLVIYLAGADVYVGDRLGKLALTKAGVEQRDRTVLDWARERRVPIAIAMAGGYGRVIDETVDIQFNTVAAALRAWQQWSAQVNGSLGSMSPSL